MSDMDSAEITVAPSQVPKSDSHAAAKVRERKVPSAEGENRSSINSRSREIKEATGETARRVQGAHERSINVLTGVKEELDEAIRVLNDSLSRAPTRIVVSKDEQLNRFVVKIADKSSGEIIREIPPERLLNFAKHLQELKGILFDDKT